MMSSTPPAGPDEIERLFRRLVMNVAELDPSRLDGPLPVVEIHQNLVPYRTHRIALGIETNQDYEMTLLRLLAGEHGLAHVEPDEVRTLIEIEARAVNPETGIYRRFPTATVHLDPDHVHTILSESHAASGGTEPAAPVRPAPGGRARPSPSPAPGPFAAPPAFAIDEPLPGATDDAETLDQPELPFSLDQGLGEPEEPSGRDITVPGAQCGYCGGVLPIGRSVIFCPHCGQNVGVMHCPVCGTDLDVGWRYCITCGREMAGLG